MKINQLHRQQGEIKSSCQHLPALAGMIDNNATTKQQAAKPSRHSLAIFAPKICEATTPTGTTGAKPSHISTHASQGALICYGGLIGANTTPFAGNNPSRLVAVVESRHPMRLHGVANLTKQQGGHTHA